MSRTIVAALVFALVGATSSSAQIFNPNINPVPSLPPPPTPSIAVPHLEPVPPVLGRSSASPPQRAPQLGLGAPTRPSFSDRALSCTHQAGAIGVPPGSIGQYTRECVNSQ